MNGQLKFGLHCSQNEESVKVYELRNDMIWLKFQQYYAGYCVENVGKQGGRRVETGRKLRGYYIMMLRKR